MTSYLPARICLEALDASDIDSRDWGARSDYEGVLGPVGREVMTNRL